MKYKIEFKSEALKFIHKQPPKQQQRIIDAINKLPGGDIKKMISVQNNNLYRLRIRHISCNIFLK